MRLGSLVSAGLGLACLVAVSGCGTTVPPRAQVVGSPECPREQAVVRRALARSHVRVDVTGDGYTTTPEIASLRLESPSLR